MSREGAKRAVLDRLRTSVPGVLARVRSEAQTAGWPNPSDPADPRMYDLRSELPTLETQFPCVLVEEVGAPRREFRAADPFSGHQTTYGMRVSVAARAFADQLERAEAARDRLADAVLEVLNTTALAGPYRLVRSSLSDETGLAATNGATASVAAAQIDFRLVADEQYPDAGTTAEQVTTTVEPTPDQM